MLVCRDTRYTLSDWLTRNIRQANIVDVSLVSLPTYCLRNRNNLVRKLNVRQEIQTGAKSPSSFAVEISPS